MAEPLDPSAEQGATVIHGRHGSTLYRVTRDGVPCVLKWFDDTCAASEVQAYRLLQGLGVPTLAVREMSDQGLLLEDLTASPDWRLAAAEDVEREDVGGAVAEWYKALHTAGARMMLGPTNVPGFLTRETDAVTPESVLATGDRLGLPHLPIWRFSAEHVEVLKREFRAIPETLNYNDFHWTNLALSRGEPVRAIVFDYHLLGIGPCHCDVRNVCGSLGGRAREAFLAAYGPVDPRVAVLDAPLGVLFSLGKSARAPARVGGPVSASGDGRRAGAGHSRGPRADRRMSALSHGTRHSPHPRRGTGAFSLNILRVHALPRIAGAGC